MFAAQPADPAAIGARGIRLTAVVGKRFSPGHGRLDDPHSAVYLPALAKATGVDFRPEILECDRGNSFTDMSAAVLPTAAAGLPVDLIVLAHAGTDYSANEVAGPQVCDQVAGPAVAFAVTDQGAIAGFTATRLATLSLSRPDVARVAVVACEQNVSTFVTEQTDLQRITADAAVGLVLERATSEPDSSPDEVTTWHGRTGPSGPVPELNACWQALTGPDLTSTGRPAGSATGAGVTVVLGAGVPAQWSPPSPAGRIERAERGLAAVAVWLKVAELVESGVRGPVVLLDHEPATASVAGCYLHLPVAAA
jgi:hypothetical protein